MPAAAVVRGVRLGCRELWNELCRVVPEADVRARELLASAAPTFWDWVNAVTDAVSLAREPHTLARQYQLAGTRQRFIERLAVASGNDPEPPRLVAELGFDPGGIFRGMVVELVA